jgi:hypothetical protein
MTADGASRPLRRIPAIVSFLNPQPALSPVGGNGSSCPKADPHGLSGNGRVGWKCVIPDLSGLVRSTFRQQSLTAPSPRHCA